MKVVPLICNLLLLVLLVRCAKPTSEQKLEDVSHNLVTCYQYNKNKDTVLLSATFMDTVVTGTLVYKLFQKDANTGTLEGRMLGDLLIADYMFSSEGVNSVRQVVFKKSGERLIEGVGDVEQQNGKTVFANIDSLSFVNTISLVKADCKK